MFELFDMFVLKKKKPIFWHSFTFVYLFENKRRSINVCIQLSSMSDVLLKITFGVFIKRSSMILVTLCAEKTTEKSIKKILRVLLRLDVLFVIAKLKKTK